MISTPYDAIAAEFHAARHTLLPKEQSYLSLLLEPLKPGSVILDLGCGTGSPIAHHLVGLGHRVVGVDASSVMLEYARQSMPDQHWIHQRMEDVELLDASFSAVVCWDSLFHLPRQSYASILQKILRWLIPGGRVMVSSGGAVDEKGSGFTDTMFGHEFYYDSLTPLQVLTTMEDMGFKILLGEMCDLPENERNKGKWATVAEKLA